MPRPGDFGKNSPRMRKRLPVKPSRLAEASARPEVKQMARRFLAHWISS